MRHFATILLILALLSGGGADRLQAQSADDRPTVMARISEDNDFINIWGDGTDNAYTNGTFINVFYTRKKPSRFFLDRISPRAGDSSTDIYGWGLNELMYTPDDLTRSGYQPGDYSYASALYATHTRYSYNNVKHYAFQTEWVLGMMGPAALGKQTQDLVHSVMDYQTPMGWGTQFGNCLLVNLNVAAEKQLFALRLPLSGKVTAEEQREIKPGLEVLSGAQANIGSMQNGLSVYPLIRIGFMRSYFSGYIDQYSSFGHSSNGSHRNQVQFYIFFRPDVRYVISNALLEGPLFSRGDGHSKTYPPGDPRAYTGYLPEDYHPALERWVWTSNFGAVLSVGHISASFMQNTSTAVLKDVYKHQYGNVSLYYSW